PDDLSVTLIGQLEGSVTGVFKKPPEDDATEGTVVLSGGGEASGRAKDNGLGDFWGEVSLEGEHDFPLDSGQIKLPDDGTTAKISVKGAVEPPGDFDAGVTGSIDTSIEVKFEANALSPEDEVAKLDFRGAIKAEVSVSLTIPLRGIANFRPDHLSSRVPEIRRLVLLRRLVLELRSYISSNPLLGVAIRDELLKAKDELEALQEAAGPVAEGEEAPRLSDGTNLAKLKAALVEQHPQLLINPTAIAATPAVTEPEPEPAPPPAE
ncbi:MAG: type VI secretion system contractile sheath small subunit, partial [Nannocystaceae bacterium]